MDKLKTDWIRAAVSGETLDGREITAQQVKDMADTYDREAYVAHIKKMQTIKLSKTTTKES
jgi:hypothetical protein